MYSERLRNTAEFRRNAKHPSGGHLLPPSKRYGPHSISSRSLAVFVILILLFSILIQFPYFGGAEPSKPTQQGTTPGLYKTTWTFADELDFNTTDTEVAGGKVGLKPYNDIWNQTTKGEFNRGDEENISITQKSYTELVWHEDFENGTNGWTDGKIQGADEPWELGPVSKIPTFIGKHDSGDYVWGPVQKGYYVDSGEPRDNYLRSPRIDLSGYENTELSIWHYYVFESETETNDGGIVEVSNNNGTTWEQVWPKEGYGSHFQHDLNPLHPTECFGGNSSAWIQSRFDISKYDGEQNFAFRFRFATNGAIGDYGWYLDDLEITSTTFSEGEVTLSERNLELGNEQPLAQKNGSLTIIDSNNPANVDGILTEWKVDIAQIIGPLGWGQMRIFSNNINNEFEFKYETDPENLTTGWNIFDCYIPVEAGDYIGWYGENVDMLGLDGGVAYTMNENVSETHPVSNWTISNFTYAIHAKGISLNPEGVLISEVFDSGSKAIWEQISWNEDVSPSETDIVIQTRSAAVLFGGEPSWLDPEYSDPITDPSGSFISSPNGRYFQFKVTLTTSVQPESPTLFNVSVRYRKYAPEGEVETNDFAPDVVVRWEKLSVSEITSDQKIDYFYSIDSGDSWSLLSGNGDYDLSAVSVLEGKIRFRMELSTADTTITPQVNDISLTYSNATPLMMVFLETETKTAEPGDIIFINIFYPNSGIGDASDVVITLFLDTNLTYRTATNNPFAPSIENIGHAIAITWELTDTSVPANTNRVYTVELNVKEIDKDIKVNCYATLNYSDIGGNNYEGVVSNSVTIEVIPGLDILYVLFLVIVVTIILVVIIIFVVKKRREREEAKKISIDAVEGGIGYLIMEDNPTKSYSLFSELIDSGHSGLCMTRTFPGRVKSTYSFEDVSILWLSRAKDPDSILPTNLGAVLRSIKDFMEGSESGVILLDGLEYLIVHNEFPRVLKLVHILNEMAAMNNSILIIPLNPLTLDEGKIALLKRDLKSLG
jgi:hypothetical protein